MKSKFALIKVKIREGNIIKFLIMKIIGEIVLKSIHFRHQEKSEI